MRQGMKLWCGVWLLITLAWADDQPYQVIPDAVLQPNTLIEFFGFSCAACYQLDKQLKPWLKNHQVRFQRIPLTFQASWQAQTLAYHVAQHFKVTERFTTLMFEAIHEQEQPLESMAEIRPLLVEAGIAEAQIEASFNSLELELLVKRDHRLAALYGVMVMPALMVHGRYLITPDTVQGETYRQGDPQAMLAVAHDLLAHPPSD